MDQEHISKVIKDIRKKNNLTQKELADKLGVTYQAVSKWENSKNIPDIEIITLICDMFNLDINEFLNNKKNKKNKLIFLFITILLICSSLLIYKMIDKHDFSFSKITTTCDNFKVSGSIAYNKDKTSIYIASVSYCEEDSNIYQRAECTFYEEYNGIKNTINTWISDKNNLKLDEYLKDIEINVSNYSTMCKTLKNSNLYLEINLFSEKDKITTYKIPLNLDENCN